MATYLQRLKDLLLDPIPIAVVCGNWLAIAYAALGQGLFGRPFHLYYESLFTQILALLNFPSLITAAFLGPLVSMLFGVSQSKNDLVVFLVFVVVAGIQWFVLTKLVKALFRENGVSI